MALFSFLDHLNLIEDDTSRYEVGIGDEGFSYLDLVSEKKAKSLTFAEKQERETGAALDGSTRAKGKSNLKQVEAIDHDDVCLDTDLMAIIRDMESRKSRSPIYPFVQGGCIVLLIVWIVVLVNLAHPLLALFISAIFVLPLIAFSLVNAWYYDKSRRDVHFSYRITGKGESAFAQLNRAMEAVSLSGQTLLYSGRRHFEDSRYTGGADSLPELKEVECQLAKPPLLDLPFDVWHLRAFNRDMYFMPDHLLVFDGSQMGGIRYDKLQLFAAPEVTQLRGNARRTSDAKVVGKTYRFVNKDGSPDQRFNNNVEIPLLEYGVLKISGSGLDVSLFVTNQRSALAVPSELKSIKQLASQPVVRVAEKRRAEAAARRAARKDQLFSVVLDAMNCMMLADGHASGSERAKIKQLMQRIHAPWNDSEVDQRMRQFYDEAMKQGLPAKIRDVCTRTSAIQDPRQQDALRKCLDQVMSADGKIDPKETAVMNQIVASLIVAEKS